MLTSDSSALATSAYTPDAADHGVAGDAHHAQYVSAALAAGIVYDVGNTIKLAIQGLEAHANNNLQVQLWVGVYSSGLALQATLRSKIAQGSELGTGLAGRFLSTTVENAYTTVSGDLLVVELSVTGSPGGGGGVQGHNASLRAGANGAGGDLAESDGETGTTLNPWFEIEETDAGQQFTLTLDESVGAADAEPRQTGKPLPDAAALADALSKLTGRSLSDAAALADAISKLTGRSLSDAAVLADAISKRTSRPLSDEAALADALSKLTGRSLSDSAALADAVTKSSGRVLADGVLIADVVQAQRITVSELLEAITASDVLTKAASREIIEGASLADILEMLTARELADPVAVADALSHLTGRHLSETATIADSLVASLVMTHTSLEATVLQDDTSVVVGRLMVDSAAVADVLSKLTGRALLESVVLADAATKAVSRGLMDAVTVEDTLQILRIQLVAMGEGVTLGDEVFTDHTGPPPPPPIPWEPWFTVGIRFRRRVQ